MKKILFILFFVLIELGFILICLEGFLRINPKLGYIYNFCKFKKEESTTLRDHNFRYIRPSALLGYEIIPNLSGIDLPELPNSYGLTGKEYKLKKENNIFRILLLGDSIAWRNQSREFLEEGLNNTLSNSKYKFEIWNAACPSYDVRRYYLYLKYKGLNYTPDMVLIYLFMNDFDLNISVYYKNQRGITEYYFPIMEISKRYTVNLFLMRHSYLYRFIILRLDTYLSNKRINKGAGYVDQKKEEGRYYLELIKEICERNKIPLFVVIFPYLKSLTEYNPKQDDEYRIICEVIKSLKIDYLNLYEHLPVENLYNLREDKDDEIHPSFEAHRLIAKLIYDRIVNDFFRFKH